MAQAHVTQSKEAIQRGLDELKQAYGDWAYDIPLPFGIWTRGNLSIPHTRLKRVVQAVSDLAGKPLSDCRVLDLGCLDGIFSIEFASHGAQTVGVEIREANIKKAIFCKEALQLDNLQFRQDDVRDISAESYGTFDAIVCSGLLYHLPATDVFALAKTMFEMVNKVVMIDTHVALDARQSVRSDGAEYWGEVYREHSDDATPEMKEIALLSSADNTTSFWFTRPSLVNILSSSGFSSVYECFTPAHINFGQPGVEHRNRCTLVAIKGTPCELETTPAANDLFEKLPEGFLSYGTTTPSNGLDAKIPQNSVPSSGSPFVKRIAAKLKSWNRPRDGGRR